MTEITDAEAAEVLWASSEQGKAAVLAACRKADDLGLTRTAGRPPAVIEPADISAIVYAAFFAAGRDAGQAGTYTEAARRHLGTLEVLMTPGEIKGEHSYGLTLLRWATEVGEFLKVIAGDEGKEQQR